MSSACSMLSEFSISFACSISQYGLKKTQHLRSRDPESIGPPHPHPKEQDTLDVVDLPIPIEIGRDPSIMTTKIKEHEEPLPE